MSVRLAKLRLVFADGIATVMRPTVQDLALPQYETGHIFVEAFRSNGDAYDLMTDTLLLGVRLHPTDVAPAIAVQATREYDDLDHEARFELVAGHWPLVPPRLYGYDVVALLGGDPDKRLVVMPRSALRVTDENVHPGDEIEVPAAQQPLAQGPAGPGMHRGLLSARRSPAEAVADGYSFYYATDAGALYFTDGTDWWGVVLEALP